MARLHRPHSTSFDHDHEPLLRDLQGQENDHERQDEEISSATNDKKPEDGWKWEKEKEDNHIYPRWLASYSREDHYGDIQPEHQDHHSSSVYSGDTKSELPRYLDLVPLPGVKVRCSALFVYKL